MRKDNMKDKLRLKNVSLKVQRKKMLLQLRQKEEVGEALHEVDFQQLKIENAQFLETIEAKNQELIQLKLASGNTLQVLNTYKVRSALMPRSPRPPTPTFPATVRLPCTAEVLHKGLGSFRLLLLPDFS